MSYIALLEKYNEGQGKTSLVGALNSGCLCFLCEYEGSHIYSSSKKYNEGQGKTSLVGALNSGCLCFLCEYEGCHIYSSSRKI